MRRGTAALSPRPSRRWPLIGTLATGAGTLYIERESRRDAMRVVHQMAAGLRAGDILAVFPEGTTSDGVGLLPFHANLIQAAISARRRCNRWR
jgi:1-acyl-sn-glycerol-3-phosphate acyltransferase